MTPFKAALATITPRRLVEIARAAVENRFDAAGWANDVTGFGTARDKTTYTTFGGVQYLADQELSNLYHGDDLAQRMVDIVPDEMLREGFTVDVRDPKANAEIADQLEALGARGKYANGIRWGRLFGCGALLIGADDGRPVSKPLDASRAKGVRYLYELDKRLMWPLTWYTEPGHPRFGEVETYLITSAAAHIAHNDSYSVVHESRLLVFGGANTGLWEKSQNNGFDRSVLQRAYDALRGFNTGWKAVEILLSDGNQAVYKLQGVADMIGANGQDLVRARVQVVDMFRSVLRAMVIDAGDAASGTGAESFERQNVSLTDYPATLDRFMLRLAAAVQVPATILYGQSPAGMNATGESDFRWFYDRIRAQQTLELAPQVRRLVRVMLQTSTSSGARDADIVVTFPSLWKEPPSAEATRRKTIAETDAIRVASGELLPEEVALTRTQPDGWDRDVALTPEGTKAREDALRASTSGDDSAASTVVLAPTDIAKVVTVNEARKSQGLGPLMLEAGGEDPEGDLTVAEFNAKHEAATGGGGFGGGPPAFGGGGNFDALDEIPDLTDALEHYPRLVIAGGPRTGKSTLAVRAGERFKRPIRYADALVGRVDWSEASEQVSTWFDDPAASWIVEGVSTPRALAKWLARNPGRPFPAAVVYLAKPIHAQSKGQAGMSSTVAGKWREIKPELTARGATIIERDE